MTLVDRAKMEEKEKRVKELSKKISLILKDKEVTGNLRDYLLEADNQLTGVDSLDQVTNKLRVELKPYADKGHLPKSLAKFYANDLMEPKSLLSILLARN